MEMYIVLGMVVIINFAINYLVRILILLYYNNKKADNIFLIFINLN